MSATVLTFPLHPRLRRYRPHGRTLRERFELLGLCPNGFVRDATACWDACADPAEIERQVASAAAWLQLCRPDGRARYVNSYQLKHEAERWCGGYVGNGCMLMAAYDLGLVVRREPVPSGTRPVYPNGRIGVSLRRPDHQ